MSCHFDQNIVLMRCGKVEYNVLRKHPYRQLSRKYSPAALMKRHIPHFPCWLVDLKGVHYRKSNIQLNFGLSSWEAYSFARLANDLYSHAAFMTHPVTPPSLTSRTILRQEESSSEGVEVELQGFQNLWTRYLIIRIIFCFGCTIGRFTDLTQWPSRII